MGVIKQIPSVILPQRAPLGTETEVITDTDEHLSLSFPVDSLQEKTVQVIAVNPGGAAAPLNMWIEIAPVDADAAYAVLGGITTIAATVNSILQWTTHSPFARVHIQVPAWAAGMWVVQVVFEGKGP